jgi:hypothetical protein
MTQEQLSDSGSSTNPVNPAEPVEPVTGEKQPSGLQPFQKDWLETELNKARKAGASEKQIDSRRIELIRFGRRHPHTNRK